MELSGCKYWGFAAMNSIPVGQLSSWRHVELCLALPRIELHKVGIVGSQSGKDIVKPKRVVHERTM